MRTRNERGWWGRCERRKGRACRSVREALVRVLVGMLVTGRKDNDCLAAHGAGGEGRVGVRQAQCRGVSQVSRLLVVRRVRMPVAREYNEPSSIQRLERGRFAPHQFTRLL